MGLFSSSWERQVDSNLFDYIDIDQFRNQKLTTIWNYSLMWILLILHTALYGVDVYTCIKLLAFDTWGSTIKPWLSFRISKWLFAACIICSVVLLIFEATRGWRVYRTRNISLIYTNTFARTLKSISGYGYFCVLNEVGPTTSFEKLAFFTYFTLHSSKKLLLADSPRQVINALTLFSVLNTNGAFFENIKQISLYNRNEALILYGMTISFFIWFFFIANLFFAVVFAIPVFYHTLHTLRFQSLRQFVCIRVDKNVKMLAKEHKLSSLKKFQLSKKNTLEKPSIPDIDIPPTPRDSYEQKGIMKNSTFDSLTSTKISTKDNPFNDPQQQKRILSEDSLQKPSELHHKPDSTVLLTRNNDYPPFKTNITDSTSSLQNLLDTTKIPQSTQYKSKLQQEQYIKQKIPQRKAPAHTQQHSPYLVEPPLRTDSRLSFDTDLEKDEGLRESQTSLPYSTDDYYDDSRDEIQNDLYNNEYDEKNNNDLNDNYKDWTNEEYGDRINYITPTIESDSNSNRTYPNRDYDNNAVFDDLFENEDFKTFDNKGDEPNSKKTEVRASLITRARNMEDEDYSMYVKR